MNTSSEHTLNRRSFLTGIALGAGAFFLPGSFSFGATRISSDDPHFFIQLLVPGGLDSSYLFDARPLEMTRAGVLQNYAGVEPVMWDGSNGQSCWAAPAAQTLAGMKNYFSVVNGVMMASSFDGHEQNLNFLLAGNPFGGGSFLPYLNAKIQRPIDSLQFGSAFGLNLNNLNSSVPLNISSAKSLVERLKGRDINSADPALRFSLQRMNEVSRSGSE